MKRILLNSLILLCLGICENHSFGQNHYLELDAGYAISVAGKTIGTRSVFSPSDTVQKELKGSFGQGHTFGFKYGYQTKKHLSFEFAVNRFVGFRYDYKTQINPPDPSLTDTTTIIYMIESQAFRFTPSIAYTIHKNKNIAYLKSGMVFAVPTLRYRERGNYGDGSKLNIESIYKGGLGLGISIEAGFEHRYNKHLSFIADIQLISMSYAPKKSTIVNYLVDGTDQIDNLSTYEQQVEYVDETAISGSFDSNKPRQAVREFFPFSSIGFHFGLRYNFCYRKAE